MVDGFCLVEVDPLPKSQNQEVGLPVDRSSKLTIIGEQPEVIFDLKSGVGICAKL